MFDVGFWELAVIFVVGLLVLGPERLPKLAVQVGQWAGKARRMARMFTTQLQDEMNAVDPRRIMDPPPPPTQSWNRPGVNDLRPGAAPEPPGTSGGPGAGPPAGNTQP